MVKKGKYDIDHGCRINGMNIAIAGLIAAAKAEDMMRHAVVAANKYFDKMYK